MATLSLTEAAAKVDAMLRHADLTSSEVEAVAALRDHAHSTTALGASRRDVAVWAMVQALYEQRNGAQWLPDDDRRHDELLTDATDIVDAALRETPTGPSTETSGAAAAIRAELVEQLDDIGDSTAPSSCAMRQTLTWAVGMVDRIAGGVEHLTLSDGTELRHRTVKSLAEGTRDDSARWTPDLADES